MPRTKDAPLERCFRLWAELPAAEKNIFAALVRGFQMAAPTTGGAPFVAREPRKRKTAPTEELKEVK